MAMARVATDLSETLTFRVKGMDCAGCVAKIESAVSRIPGTQSVKVGLTSEVLSVESSSPIATQVQATVRSLGYEISRLSEERPAAGAAASPDADHSDHSKPIEGAWWKSSKGKSVITTGVLIAFAYFYSIFYPSSGMLLFLAAAVGGALPIARRALSAAYHGAPFTIEMLMTIAVIGAVFIGAAEEAAIVVFLFGIGELLESVAAGRARAGIRALADIVPKTAFVEKDGKLVETPIAQIAVGSIIVVRPGDRVPADSTVLSGASAVDESALTGESVPKSKEPGSTVYAGSINTEAALRCCVERPAQDTLIARVVRLVEEAADAKAPTERFIDRFSRYYMPAICLLALIVAVGPPLLMNESWQTWIYRGLTLLLIGCPCALVISTPAAIASALAAGARRGMLVKGGGVLEAIGKVTNIAFDKTGTLTAGKPKVTEIRSLIGMQENEILSLAAAAEESSSHPLAVAIVAEAKSRGLTYKAASSSSAIPGKGINANVDGRSIVIGAATRIGITSPDVLEQAKAFEREGKSVSVVQIDGIPAGIIALRDEPRPDAKSGLDEIKALGVNPIMLTGDNRANAEAIGRALGIEVKAELLPEDKLAEIKRLSAAGGGIAKVGDGINDAPALAAATVDIAMGSGTDVALEAADAAILNNRIVDVARLISLSRRTLSIVHQNVAIALGLKLVFLVTTVLGLTGLWIAILADTGATVLVTANSLRLMRK